MELINKRKKENSKTARFTFAVSEKMKKSLDEIRDVDGVDVNEMLRQHSEHMIKAALAKRTA